MDGMIALDSDYGKIIGFTSDRFIHGSYLWRKGNSLIVSFIGSTQERKGYFRQLAEFILASGLTLEIPTPMGRMQDIVRKSGYVETWPYCELYGECIEIWVKSPSSNLPQ